LVFTAESNIVTKIEHGNTEFSCKWNNRSPHGEIQD
jgi:hypothetical protein